MEYKFARKREVFLLATRISVRLEGSIFLANQIQAEKKTVGAHLHIFYRHTRIDHRRFFSSFHPPSSFCPPTHVPSGLESSEEAKKNEETRTGGGPGDDGPNEYRRYDSRVGEPAVLSPSPRNLVYRIALFLTLEIYICRHTAGHFFCRLSSLSARRS